MFKIWSNFSHGTPTFELTQIETSAQKTGIYAKICFFFVVTRLNYEQTYTKKRMVGNNFILNLLPLANLWESFQKTKQIFLTHLEIILKKIPEY